MVGQIEAFDAFTAEPRHAAQPRYTQMDALNAAFTRAEEYFKREYAIQGWVQLGRDVHGRRLSFGFARVKAVWMLCVVESESLYEDTPTRITSASVAVRIEAAGRLAALAEELQREAARRADAVETATQVIEQFLQSKETTSG